MNFIIMSSSLLNYMYSFQLFLMCLCVYEYIDKESYMSLSPLSILRLTRTISKLYVPSFAFRNPSYQGNNYIGRCVLINDLYTSILKNHFFHYLVITEKRQWPSRSWSIESGWVNVEDESVNKLTNECCTPQYYRNLPSSSIAFSLSMGAQIKLDNQKCT